MFHSYRLPTYNNANVKKVGKQTVRALVIRSGIKRPFSPIDRSIMRGMRQLNVKVAAISPGKGLNERITATIRNQKPDFIFVLMGWRLTKRNVLCLKRVRNIPKMIWFTDDPYYLDWSRTVGRYFDIVFTNESCAVPVYRQNGCSRVYHMPLGVDPEDFFPREEVPERFRSDVLVLGTAFRNRLAFIERLLPHLSSNHVRLVGPGWDQLRISNQKKAIVYTKWVSLEEANAYYNGAHIVLNIHRSPRDEYLKLNRGNVPANTPNNRTFEVAACGAFQLVEDRPDLTQLYASQAKIPTFRTPYECLNLIRYFLPREKKRKEIAASVYQYTLSSHQYIHRLQDVLAIISEESRSP